MSTPGTPGPPGTGTASSAGSPGQPQDGGIAGRIDVRGLTASYGGRPAITSVDITLQPRKVTAFIGPSGCGKTTLLRCMNGLHLTVARASVTGLVQLDETDIYGKDVDLVQVRRHVGMVFQRPNPFPTMSVADNVTAGLRFGPRQSRRGAKLDEIIERSLRQAGLWDEVKDRLGKPGAGLSGGQQQRLCIARALATKPSVLLMDEPCSALDPIATTKIEDLITKLKTDYTIVIVTHNMQQAGRVSDLTGFFLLGKLIEYNRTRRIMTEPKEKQTEDYITGRFG